MRPSLPIIAAVDLFCGAGGLSLGLEQAGVTVKAGIDLDPACAYPYEQNLAASFLLRDISNVTGDEVSKLWGGAQYTLLAGCAPCQPFSSHRRGIDTSDEKNWDLLSHFGRIVRESTPDFVTMENVPRLAKMQVFLDFVAMLRGLDYAVDYGTLYGPQFGLPQERRRLVLVASKVGVVRLPKGTLVKEDYRTVEDTISQLPNLISGESDPADPLHTARQLSPLNLKRIKASKPGGTWRDWPEDLRAECHKKATGASFQSFYGRMTWEAPSPTITTQAFNYGTGRFGHPTQHRSLTLREAAMLQGFPRDYKFVADGERPAMSTVGRLIGNAVPPAFGAAVGLSFMEKVRELDKAK
ncbi:DNA (cytosine-5-)-methyltransferase [Rathayibacter caricis DSM 15933]|uniref:DNA (cytosine-5-)-methyltransferase n=1 Tax=Rathayibacter caricis DSM 15933 TaxID=1328867 RepID=A0A2T4UUM5_9MICO|nr:DNA cytosine methyltransferase [Rathayibacter caricis]PTL73226.1 DNA (cytosine-5-)-methyltransferase [Rathayibacter caricis DSM 15933]